MFRVFNMGVGFTLVVRPRAVDEIIERVVSFGLEIYRLGTVVEGERKVELVG
jgi:phosphoribosylformylglycinamidine cyclo-ligase